MKLEGLRIGIMGMAKSGLSLLEAALQKGNQVVIFDEKPLDSPERISLADQIMGMGAEVISSWTGRFEEDLFDLLVTSPGFSKNHPAFSDALKMKKRVIGEIEFAWQISQSPILAITGTNGKSTTCVMTWQILKHLGVPAVLCGNISGSGYPEMTLTEAALKSRPDQVLVAEISSFQLEWIQEFKPKIATITNITPDHLNRYNSFEDYFKTKLKLFSNMGREDTIVVNCLEPTLGLSTIKKYCKQDVKIVDLKIESIELNLSEHNKINAQVAIKIVQEYLNDNSESTYQKCLECLKKFIGLNHRMEVLGEKDGVLIVNNSMCTNPMAVLTSSQNFNKRQHLLMGGFGKLLDFSKVGLKLKNLGHEIYIYGSNSSEFYNELGNIGATYSDIDSALEAALIRALPGEAIILSPGCASAFPFTNFRERGDYFKNRVKELLNE